MSIRKLITPALLAIALLQSEGVYAQTDSLGNQLSVGLEFVTHGEVCGGGLPLSGSEIINEKSSKFLFGRTRVAVDYKRQGLQAYAVLQNKAVWGMSRNQALNLYEGWVKMSSKSGFFGQIGRVALSYDDERIIGPNDFAVAALSHDVVRAGYEGHGHQLHAVMAYNQDDEQVYSGTYYGNGSQPYKTMQILWYHYDVPKIPLGVSLLFMNVGLQAGYPEVDQNKDPEGYEKYKYNPARTVNQRMLGGYICYHPSFMNLECSYYKQKGKEVDDILQVGKIDAWMARFKATVTPWKNYGFQLGYDYLSGDDYVPIIYGGMAGLVQHKENNGFCPLYGSRSKFYGIMDYFYESAYSCSFTPGLQNAFAGVNASPTSKLEGSVIYHYMATASKLRNLSRTLGHAIEIQASYKFTKDITLAVGFTQMKGTETMDLLKQGQGTKHANWGWFSLVVRPSLFTAKW